MFFELSFVPILNESSRNWIYAKHADAISITLHAIIRMHITQISQIRIYIIDHKNKKGSLFKRSNKKIILNPKF